MLAALLHGITLRHISDFCCLSCFHSSKTENELKFYEIVCENKGFCGILMLSEKDNILEFNQYMKSGKLP